MKQSANLVFFGTEDFSAVSLQALITDGWRIALVVTKPDTPRGRKQVVTEPEVKKNAKQHNIPVLQPLKVMEVADQIAKLQPRIGVLVAYGKIIPQAIIDLFPLGILNVHPSLLPAYRGPSPIESAIKNGDTKTGISLMSLSAAMDAGPIYHQIDIPLLGTETRPQLYKKLAKLGGNLLIKKMPSILDGTLLSTPQDEAKATYCKLLTKSDALLDLSLPAKVLERIVRAHVGYPKSKIELYGHEVVVTKTRVTEQTNGSQLIVHCGQNTYLEILELVGPSGKTMSGADFLRGYKPS